MTAQDYGIILGTIGFITAAYGLIIKLLWSKFDGVQYKDNCGEIVKRIDKQADERHREVKVSLERIERLIRNGGSDDS